MQFRVHRHLCSIHMRDRPEHPNRAREPQRIGFDEVTGANLRYNLKVKTGKNPKH